MMMPRKRIALFAGQAEEAYQSRFITGFLKESFAADCDVCVFSMYRKYQDTAEREAGESNIFSLMNPAGFDGAVILKDSIQTEHAAERLEEHLKSVFDKPVVVIEGESTLFPGIGTDCYSSEYDLVSHLIEVHHCRDIRFLSGKKWHKHAQERLRAYRDAMRDHGLEVQEDWILYGDFWYQSGELCAEQILSQGKPYPDAVACANDQMAIGLCKALTAHGVRVPEDIAVVGYDSCFEGQTSPRSLTSAEIPAEEFGAYAFRFLADKTENRTSEPFRIKPRMLLGESCGCPGTGMVQHRIRRENWGTDISEEGYNSVFNMMDESLIVQSSLQEFLSTVYSYVYQLPEVSAFHLCLGSDWRYVGQNIHLPHEGYPEEMLHAIRYSSDRKHDIADADLLFPSAEMLPELGEERSTPAAYFFTPLFFDAECFGYAAVSYGSRTRSYDEIYRRWISSVCRGFEVLRRNLVLKQMQEHLERIRNNKFAASDHSYEALNDEEKQEYQLVSTILDENLLDYHFQPIVSAEDGSVYAYEALMRSRTEQRVSPLAIIRYAAMQHRLADVEHSTFMNVLRILDEKKEAFSGARVFINSIPGVSVRGEESPVLNQYLSAHSQQIVVELTEETELTDGELRHLKDYYERMRIDIAVDDYGTGYSNVSNLLRYMPNYVKIDRSLLSEIQNQMQKQHFVREIIDFCHDNDILALAEGIETAEELQTVIHLGVDLIQGFYTARPAPEIVRQISEIRRNEIRRFYQERVDGLAKRLCIAGKTSRLYLTKLIKDGCTDIIVGQEGMVYKDISVIGSPQMHTDMHMRIESGYSGRITLENACFSNIKNRPCIELGEHTDVTLVLSGTNTLIDAGIQVPESSRLVIEGAGELTLELNAPEAYGIGNTHDARHGELIFQQYGAINISSRGMKCVGIGSGLGGIIRIHCGEYNLKLKTGICLGIGSFSGAVSLHLMNCHVEADVSATYGVMIGSMGSDAEISVRNSAVNCRASARYLAGMGTLHGSRADIDLAEASLDFQFNADHVTCLGSLYGASDIRCEYLTLKLSSSGQEAVAFGGYNEDTSVCIVNCDTQVVVSSKLGKDTYAPANRFRVINGVSSFLVNGEIVEHSTEMET